MITRIKSLFQRFFFNLWYFRDPPWDTGISPPELIAFLEQNKPGRALDLGCGTGTNVLTMAQYGWEAIGVDYVARAVQTARKKAKQAELQVEFFVDDVTRLELISGKFDLILDIGCLHSIVPARRKAYYQNLKRLLRSGGTYLLYAFMQNSETDSQTGLNQADLSALNSQLKLIKREDGIDRGTRPSSWFTFQAIKDRQDA